MLPSRVITLSRVRRCALLEGLLMSKGLLLLEGLQSKRRGDNIPSPGQRDLMFSFIQRIGSIVYFFVKMKTS